jgi:hypothetical protein
VIENRLTESGVDVSLQYADLAQSPHRRPAYSLNAPALTRHLMLRPKVDTNPIDAHDKSETERRGKILTDRVNAMLGRAQSDIRAPAQFAYRDSKSDGVNLIDHRDSLFCTLPQVKSCRLRLRADLHSEFLTLTLLADSFAAAGTGIHTLLGSLQENDCENRPTADAVITRLYKTFWEGIDEEAALKLDELSMEIFGDFRGFVACPPVISQPLKGLGHHDVQLPLSGMQEQRRSQQVDDALTRFVGGHSNFFSSIYGLRPNETEHAAEQDANVVMCGMDGGSAIYGSALGKQTNSTFAPLRYFLIYNGYSASQLGRLVRRLHGMAELRTAALMDIPALRRASRGLRVLGYEADKATADEKDPDVAGFLNRRLTLISALCVGGLTYRINRSRHYAQTYRDRLRDLRVVRIEGWQPYDAFARRNIFKDFDYINRIGVRYDVISQRIERLSQMGQTSQMHAHVQKLRDLQELAEVVGAAAFIYYGGAILSYVLSAWNQVTDFATCAAKCIPGLPSGIGEALKTKDGPEALAHVIGVGIAALAYVIFRFAIFPAIRKRRDANKTSSAWRAAERKVFDI